LAPLARVDLPRCPRGTLPTRRKAEIFGIAHTPVRVESRDLRPRTPIRNLFLTGQDVGTEGIVAGLSGAITTDSVMLRRNLFRTISRAAEHDHHAASKLEAAGGLKVT
jgi:hypothetical protein